MHAHLLYEGAVGMTAREQAVKQELTTKRHQDAPVVAIIPNLSRPVDVRPYVTTRRVDLDALGASLSVASSRVLLSKNNEKPVTKFPETRKQKFRKMRAKISNKLCLLVQRGFMSCPCSRLPSCPIPGATLDPLRTYALVAAPHSRPLAFYRLGF